MNMKGLVHLVVGGCIRVAIGVGIKILTCTSMEMITSKDANNNSIKSTLSRYYHISLSTGRCRLIRDKADPLFEEMQRCERERAKCSINIR